MKRNITRRNDIFLAMSFFKTLAIPHPHHKKRSLLLQPKAFIGYFIFVIALIWISYNITSSMPSVLGYADNINISDLYIDTNKMREEHGLPELKMNSTLSKAAKAKAEDMFAKDYWAHNSPDGKEPWDFIIAAGYDYLYAGENLAVDFNNSDAVVEAWYDSPSHRENLLNGKYSEIGFAVVDGDLQGRKTTLVVQMFGYPRNYAPSISSAADSAPEPAVESANTEVAIVESYEQNPVAENVGIPSQEIVQENIIPADTEEGKNIEANHTDGNGIVLKASDIMSFSRYIAIIFGLFVTVLFAIDGYYIRKMGVFRVSGHTILHILMLIAAIAGIWYTQFGLVL